MTCLPKTVGSQEPDLNQLDKVPEHERERDQGSCPEPVKGAVQAATDRDGAGTVVGKGAKPLTVTNYRGYSTLARVTKNGGLLMTGNPGHDGSKAGAPKKITRDALLEASGEAAPAYREARNEWMALAKKYRTEGPEFNLSEAERCQKRADAIQERYERYGMGTRVTSVVERPEWIAKTGTAFDSACEAKGIDPEFAAPLRAEMFRLLKESLD